MHIIISLSPSFFPRCERFTFRYYPRFTSLDLSRCKDVTGGLEELASDLFLSSFAVTCAQLFPLVEDCLLKGVTDGTMSTLGKAAPFLHALDLSYFRDLHNSSPDALVACIVLWHPHLLSINKTVTCSIRLNTGNLQRNRFEKARQDIISYWYNCFVKNSFLYIYSRGLLHVAIAQILQGVA